MKYACVRTDNMSGTINGKDLVSLKYEGAIENGSVVEVGAHISGEREVRVATAPAVAAKLGDLALIASPEVVKNKNHYGISAFINEEGAICRGYRLCSKDVYSVTKEAFVDGSVLAVGSVVELAGGVKVKAVETATEGNTTIGKIILVEGEWYVIEIA